MSGLGTRGILHNLMGLQTMHAALSHRDVENMYANMLH